jgi:hypothetical protein
VSAEINDSHTHKLVGWGWGHDSGCVCGGVWWCVVCVVVTMLFKTMGLQPARCGRCSPPMLAGENTRLRRSLPACVNCHGRLTDGGGECLLLHHGTQIFCKKRRNTKRWFCAILNFKSGKQILLTKKSWYAKIWYCTKIFLKISSACAMRSRVPSFLLFRCSHCFNFS